MTESRESMEALAERVRTAMEAADLPAFGDLLAPDVQWGPPGARRATCRNREQVLTWYRRGKAAGGRALISEVVPIGDCLLVGLQVRGSSEARERGGIATRWQILAVREGLIHDIVGFDDRSEALAHAETAGGESGQR
jgi:hypothetical protein